MLRVMSAMMAGLFFIFAGGVCSAQEKAMPESMPEATMESEQATDAVNVGNTICPVSGETIDESTKATYEYKGKVYNFCCAACIDTFKADPEKYISKVQEELSGMDSSAQPMMQKDMPCAGENETK